MWHSRPRLCSSAARRRRGGRLFRLWRNTAEGGCATKHPLQCRSMPLFTKTPRNFYVSHNSTITGDVKIAEFASIWFNAVVRGDVAPVSIGRRTNVQDGAVVHCDSGFPNVIEDDVVIGHRAVVHGQFVGRGSLIGMGAILLSRTRVGRECLVAAGAVLPPDFQVPDRMLVMGVPGKIVRPVKDEELEYMRWLVPHYVELAQKHVEGEIQLTKFQ